MTGVGNGSRERKLTRTMFCVVILSILYSTYFLIRILLATNCISEKTFFILRPIYSLLFVINSSANLFIYLYFNNKFRDNFVTIFSCNKKNQNVLDTSRLQIVSSPIVQMYWKLQPTTKMPSNVLHWISWTEVCWQRPAMFYLCTHQDKIQICSMMKLNPWNLDNLSHLYYLD